MTRKVRERLRLGLMAALGVVLAVSLGMLVLRAHQEKVSDEADLEAAELVKLPKLPEISFPPAVTHKPQPTPGETAGEQETETPEPEESLPPPREDPYAQALADMDFRALRELNPDVMGWLVIPGTGISYPLLQGETNDTYLRHTWRGEYSNRGSIFLDCQCSRDLTDFNTIVYGHRMRNGTMFAPLANYGQESYRLAHPCVYIATESGTYRYEIFAVYETDTSSKAYQIGMGSEKVKQGFIDYCLEKSFLNTGLKPTPADRVLTLSTCTPASNDERLVVQAVLWGEREETPQDSAPAEGAPEESAPAEGETLLPPEALEPEPPAAG